MAYEGGAVISFPRQMKRGPKARLGPCADVYQFPTEERKRAIVRDWLYLQMSGHPQGEGFARYWSNELSGSVSTRPQDMANMLGDLAAAREARP